MINRAMRSYIYHTLGAIDAYGQAQMQENVGTIKIALNITSQSAQDNILYRDAAYIGLTKEPINDTFVIQNGEEKLKVLYVNTLGRYNQAFLKRMV